MPSLFGVAARRWRETARHAGAWRATSALARELWDFLRDSTPERRRARYGDIDYDLESGADTTAANVGWRTRLYAALAGAPYMPTVPAEFAEILQALAIPLAEYTFVDIGSGKGRALLLAAEHGFRRVVGVEIAPELHAAAQQNVAKWREQHSHGPAIDLYLGDAVDFELPAEPLVVYLFNPLPEAALASFLVRLERSLAEQPRAVHVIYHNPLLGDVLEAAAFLERVGGTHQWSLYRARK